MLHRNFPITCRFKKKHKFSSPVFYFISSATSSMAWPSLSLTSVLPITGFHLHTCSCLQRRKVGMLCNVTCRPCQLQDPCRGTRTKLENILTSLSSKTRIAGIIAGMAKWDVKKTPCINTGICGNKILTKITRKQKGARMGIEKIACTLRSVSFTKSSVWSEKKLTFGTQEC